MCGRSWLLTYLYFPSRARFFLSQSVSQYEKWSRQFLLHFSRFLSREAAGGSQTPVRPGVCVCLFVWCVFPLFFPGDVSQSHHVQPVSSLCVLVWELACSPVMFSWEMCVWCQEPSVILPRILRIWRLKAPSLHVCLCVSEAKQVIRVRGVIQV